MLRRIVLSIVFVTGSAVVGLGVQSASAAPPGPPQVYTAAVIVEMSPPTLHQLGMVLTGTMSCVTPSSCTSSSGTLSVSLTFLIPNQCGGPVTGTASFAFAGSTPGTTTTATTQTEDVVGYLPPSESSPLLGYLFGEVQTALNTSAPKLLLIAAPHVVCQTGSKATISTVFD